MSTQGRELAQQRVDDCLAWIEGTFDTDKLIVMPTSNLFGGAHVLSKLTSMSFGEVVNYCSIPAERLVDLGLVPDELVDSATLNQAWQARIEAWQKRERPAWEKRWSSNRPITVH